MIRQWAITGYHLADSMSFLSGRTYTLIIFLLSMSLQIGIHHLIELLTRTGSSVSRTPQARRSTQNVFMHQWSFNSTSFVSSLFFMLKLLGSSPISSALMRQWSFAGAPCFSFHLLLFVRQMVVHSKRKLAAGFDPSTFELAVAY